MEEKKFLKLNDIEAYKSSFNLNNTVYSIVSKWDNFPKDTVGKQFVRSVDSISANIAEGFGRYFKKDKIKFYHYSFGSVQESLDWNEKAKKRSLISKDEYDIIFNSLSTLPQSLNYLIKYTNQKLKK